MPEDFDIGPLGWVKDEIDHALRSVLDILSRVSASQENAAEMRFAQTHLYQVNGALDMVGLVGCKRFCSEMESLAAKLEKKVILPVPETMETLMRSVNALMRYLQGLLDGAPDMPLRLYPEFEAMAAIEGESYDESELFFPDTSILAPKEITSLFSQPENPVLYLAGQRGQFQKCLLGWFKNAGPEAIAGIRAVFENIQKSQPQPAQATLWWVAGAFADAIEQDAIAGHLHVKRLFRKIDQYIKSMTEGTTRVPGSLLRDILYFVALSQPDTDRIAQVKSLFELNHLISAEGEKPAGAELTVAENAALSRLMEAIPEMKDAWMAVSEDQGSALDNFLLKLSEHLDAAEILVNEEIKVLYRNIHELVTALDLDPGKKTESTVIEVATAIMLIEDALKLYPRLESADEQRLADESGRISAILEGREVDGAEFETAGRVDRGVLTAVAEQVNDALKTVEQTLDTFFRNPASRQVLSSVDKPLQQVASAFDVLSMALPALTAKTCASLVDYYGKEDHPADQGAFELLAENLSLLELYASQLATPHNEYGMALELALGKLQEKIRQLGVPFEAATQKTELSGPEIAATPQKAMAECAPDSELLDIYLTEAEEVLVTIAQNLQALRINATDHEALTDVRRGFHTLKGSGRTVGLHALGEAAWSVEKLLNLVMERRQAPTHAQLDFVEEANAAFARWTDQLRKSGAVSLDSQEWLRRGASLEDAAASAEVPAEPEYVLVGGTRKLSRALFDVFMAEARRHMQTIQSEIKGLNAVQYARPSDPLHRAAHTLASNAGAAGFNAISDLSRALEHWLDAHHGHWTEQSLVLIGNVAEALSTMLEKAGQLRQPRRQSGLLAALKEVTLGEQSQPEAIEPVYELLPEAESALAEEAGKTQEAVAAPEPVAMPALGRPVRKRTAKPEKHGQADDELLTMFIEEARELLPQVGNELRAWRASPLESDHPDALQRALHTLKGSARTTGQKDIGDAVHNMEDRIVKVLKHKGSPVDFDELFLDLDRVGSLLEDLLGLSAGARGQVVDNALDIPNPARSVNRRAQYLRLRSDMLDRLINEAGEVSIARSRMFREMQAFKQYSLDLTESVQRLRNYLRELEIEAETQMQSRMTHLQETNESFDPLEFDRFTRLQELTRMMAESVNDVSTIQHSMLMNLDETESALQQQSRMNRDLQHGLMSVRMVPFALISERLQRIVRQTARELGKEVNLTIEGEAVSVDRSVLERMGAPLEHLLRNAVAHGIEAPAQRKKKGKPAAGDILLKVRQESDEIILTVTDDGAGIDVNRVREKAVERGLIAGKQKVDEQALLSVIFEPGFSTAAQVSQIAGRGVGLDSVRSDITGLGGRIDVNHAAGRGATFSIYLPVSLVVAQVVLVRAGTKIFAVPAVMVEQVQKLKASSLADAYSAGMIHWSERQYPLHFMSRLIGDMEQAPEAQVYTPIMLLRSGTYRIALDVDEIVSNQEIVMKSIGPQLARVPGVMGATVLGDGKVILVINPVQLANREALAIGSVKVSVAEPVQADVSKMVLVVDDSLTMRKVLGRLLEREGYRVITAKDGVDALQALQDTLPDIILSDIEMPRMDGFEFTRSVRGDIRTKDIPIIIISSRTAEKHRSLAQEIGVNAYLGKPVQDDDLLLQISHFLEYAR